MNIMTVLNEGADRHAQLERSVAVYWEKQRCGNNDAKTSTHIATRNTVVTNFIPFTDMLSNTGTLPSKTRSPRGDVEVN